ncbi:unnamed protein product [Enterobius vermicularis]|uniref:Ovule protein n=1 Tax=Enterobius vermicularis TaxID=51028 RepID=A0A0N4V328_ENTVE|nr:unnamed protein product [Enterobius vermicularis]
MVTSSYNKEKIKPQPVHSALSSENQCPVFYPPLCINPYFCWRAGDDASPAILHLFMLIESSVHSIRVDYLT